MMKSKKTCGFCAFFLTLDEQSGHGWCFRNQVADKSTATDATVIGCTSWLDCNVRYVDNLKYIDDKRTLGWIKAVLDDAFLSRSRV